MSVVNQFVEKVKGRGLSVVLPEGGDARIVQAARRIKDQQLAEPIVVGKMEQVEAAVAEAGVSLDGITVIDPRTSDRIEAYAEQYMQRRDVAPPIAARLVKKPLMYGGMMVARGDADAMVAGAASATASVIQAGALAVGYAEGINTPSSFFLMVIPELEGERDKPLIYADCAVNIQPTAEELADIALASAASAAKLLGEAPRVAMISFSTRGSAAHADVDKVTQALAIARARNGELAIDGEFQADTAISPRVAAKKVKDDSPVAGRANVLIFPDLDTGNAAYKLTQYTSGAQALGPFLQGFARPVSDLSRGASVDDIVSVAAITLAQV